MISKKFAKRRKDSAVSPVIATILMVAITVVLAAVLYVMVSGFTHNPGTAQSAGLNEAQTTSTSWNISVSSVSASNIPLSNLKVIVSGTGGGTFAAPATYPTTGAGSPGAGPVAFGTGTTVTFGVVSGNSGTYLNVGDYIIISGSFSGSTVTLYSGNTQLGSVTL